MRAPLEIFSGGALSLFVLLGPCGFPLGSVPLPGSLGPGLWGGYSPVVPFWRSALWRSRCPLHLVSSLLLRCGLWVGASGRSLRLLLSSLSWSLPTRSRGTWRLVWRLSLSRCCLLLGRGLALVRWWAALLRSSSPMVGMLRTWSRSSLAGWVVVLSGRSCTSLALLVLGELSRARLGSWIS